MAGIDVGLRMVWDAINRVVMAMFSGWLGFTKTEPSKLSIRKWQGGAEAFSKLAATWLTVGVEFGGQMNAWAKLLPHGIRKQWFAQTLPDLHECTRQLLEKLSRFVDSGRFDLREANSLHQAFTLAGCLPVNTRRARSIKEARTRLVVGARRVKLKILTENFTEYTADQKRELKEVLKPVVELYARL